MIPTGQRPTRIHRFAGAYRHGEVGLLKGWLYTVRGAFTHNILRTNICPTPPGHTRGDADTRRGAGQQEKAASFPPPPPPDGGAHA